MEGKTGKIFLDSGAEINVIDSNLLERLAECNKNIHIEFKKTYISCANGSRMESKRIATILVGLGRQSSFQKFMVIDNLFPRVFLGIKAMKHMDVILDARNERAIIKGVHIPFISVEKSTEANLA